MASVTPQRNFAPGGPGGTGRLDGYISTFFNPRGAQLQIDAIASDGTPQAQGVIILIICPSPESEGEAVRRFTLCAAVVAGSLLLWCSVALSASYHVSVCGPWSSNTGPFTSATVPGISVQVFGCGSTAANMALQASGVPPVPNGQGASWTATAPGRAHHHAYLYRG